MKASPNASQVPALEANGKSLNIEAAGSLLKWNGNSIEIKDDEAIILLNDHGERLLKLVESMLTVAYGMGDNAGMTRAVKTLT